MVSTIVEEKQAAVTRDIFAPAERRVSAPVVPANVFRAAEKSAELVDRLHSHFRETRRVSVEIPVDLELRLSDQTIFATGTGVMKDMSPSGALVGAIKLSTDCLPMQNFSLRLILKSDAYQGIGIEAVPVRFAHEANGLGVKFEEIFVAV